MKILLVDDEERVLEGLERILMQTAPEDWEILQALGGESALEILAREGDVDVVVSDMRMAPMDGAVLLARVHADYPSAMRFVLSGQMDEETAMRAVPHAHQYLAKPCPAERLLATVTRALALRDELSDGAMRRAVGDLDRLPPVPATYAELTRALDNPEVGMSDVAKIVARDPAMTTKLLQLVNSAFFARGTPVSDVEAAVRRLGLKTLQAVALGAAALKSPAKPIPGFDADDVARRSARAAMLAKNLASPADSADAFLTALLSCVGLFALAHAHPEGLTSMVEEAGQLGLPLGSAGTLPSGLSHPRVGAYLLGLWGLPDRVVRAVALQADAPAWTDAPHAPLLSCVHVATRVAFDVTPDAAFVEQAGLTESLAAALLAEAA